MAGHEKGILEKKEEGISRGKPKETKAFDYEPQLSKKGAPFV